MARAYYEEAALLKRSSTPAQIKPAGFRRPAKGTEMTLEQIQGTLAHGRGMPVFKTGRSTVATVGNMVKVQPDFKTTYYDAIGESGGGRPHFTVEGRALQVLNNHDGWSLPFADLGDSGSVVLDQHGHAVGILVAVYTILKLAYVTPWSVVKQDVMETLAKQGFAVRDIEVI